MIRYRIINEVKAKELGIESIVVDKDNFLIFNEAILPKGMSVENVVAFAEKMGIILKFETKDK